MKTFLITTKGSQMSQVKNLHITSNRIYVVYPIRFLNELFIKRKALILFSEYQ